MSQATRPLPNALVRFFVWGEPKEKQMSESNRYRAIAERPRLPRSEIAATAAVVALAAEMQATQAPVVELEAADTEVVAA